MRMRSRMAALTAGVAGLLAAFATPAAAGASAEGGLTICNYRAQSIHAEFPQRGGWSIGGIAPGTCRSGPLSNGRANEQVVVYAHYSGGHNLAVDHFFFDSRTWYTRLVR
jgi:hypothetical protein